MSRPREKASRSLREKNRPLTVGLFEKFMEEKVTGAMAKLGSDLTSRMDNITERVDTEEIEQIKLSLRSISTSQPAHNGSYESKQYNISRHSLRVWPVRGRVEAKIWDETGTFIHDVLPVPEAEVGQDSIQ